MTLHLELGAPCTRMWNVVVAWIQPGFCWSEAILISTFLVPFTGFFELKKLLSPWKIFGKRQFCAENGVAKLLRTFCQVAFKREAWVHFSQFQRFVTCKMQQVGWCIPAFVYPAILESMLCRTYHDTSWCITSMWLNSEKSPKSTTDNWSMGECESPWQKAPPNNSQKSRSGKQKALSAPALSVGTWNRSKTAMTNQPALGEYRLRNVVIW